MLIVFIRFYTFWAGKKCLTGHQCPPFRVQHTTLERLVVS